MHVQVSILHGSVLANAQYCMVNFVSSQRRSCLPASAQHTHACMHATLHRSLPCISCCSLRTGKERKEGREKKGTKKRKKEEEEEEEGIPQTRKLKHIPDLHICISIIAHPAQTQGLHPLSSRCSNSLRSHRIQSSSWSTCRWTRRRTSSRREGGRSILQCCWPCKTWHG